MKDDHKIIKVNGDFVLSYITLWNGTWKLTEKEIDVLVAFIKSYLRLKDDGLKEPYLSKLLFSTESKREIKLNLGKMTDQGLANYISSLKKKGILREISPDGIYVIDERVIPVKKITFEFK